MYKFLLSISRLLAANKNTLRELCEQINEIMDSIVGPIAVALSGAAAVYLIVLGVQYAKADDESKRTEAKKRLVNLAIGFVMLLVLTALCYLIPWDGIAELFGYAAEDFDPNSIALMNFLR